MSLCVANASKRRTRNVSSALSPWIASRIPWGSQSTHESRSKGEGTRYPKSTRDQSHPVHPTNTPPVPVRSCPSEWHEGEANKLIGCHMCSQRNCSQEAHQQGTNLPEPPFAASDDGCSLGAVGVPLLRKQNKRRSQDAPSGVRSLPGEIDRSGASRNQREAHFPPLFAVERPICKTQGMATFK